MSPNFVDAVCIHCKTKGSIKSRFSWNIWFIPLYILIIEMILGFALDIMSGNPIDYFIFILSGGTLMMTTVILGIPFSFLYWLLTRNKQKCEACGVNIK